MSKSSDEELKKLIRVFTAYRYDKRKKEPVEEINITSKELLCRVASRKLRAGWDITKPSWIDSELLVRIKEAKEDVEDLKATVKERQTSELLRKHRPDLTTPESIAKARKELEEAEQEVSKLKEELNQQWLKAFPECSLLRVDP